MLPRLSVASRSSVETAGRIELDFCTQSTLRLVLQYVIMGLRYCEKIVLFSRTLSRTLNVDAFLFFFRHGTSIVATVVNLVRPTDDRRQFVAPSVHLCVQHFGGWRRAVAGTRSIACAVLAAGTSPGSSGRGLRWPSGCRRRLCAARSVACICHNSIASSSSSSIRPANVACTILTAT